MSDDIVKRARELAARVGIRENRETITALADEVERLTRKPVRPLIDEEDLRLAREIVGFSDRVGTERGRLAAELLRADGLLKIAWATLRSSNEDCDILRAEVERLRAIWRMVDIDKVEEDFGLLTARAESAERERDAARAVLRKCREYFYAQTDTSYQAIIDECEEYMARIDAVLETKPDECGTKRSPHAWCPDDDGQSSTCQHCGAKP